MLRNIILEAKLFLLHLPNPVIHLIQVMPEDYDYNQELARAAFADMLHDSERNQLYRY